MLYRNRIGLTEERRSQLCDKIGEALSPNGLSMFPGQEHVAAEAGGTFEVTEMQPSRPCAR